ncbi:hypothetical protein GCM10025862_13620 [Arsenicicoccus piscis]|uniref:Beta-lactamase class A catalytic domain-containing protein n=1 Tax=Arsenicicoccus piscis TaxID=673954 RepID=A0ABQ6HLR6_9MICO|nr:hypothetical protein GCM10025862_13620 [Arsenicicoccus piscis]
MQVCAEQGVVAGFDADRVVSAASLVKVPILVALLREVDAGRARLDQSVALPPVAERVGGSGALALLPSVEELTIGELLRLMVVLSDNDAGNLMLDYLGLDRITATAREIGMQHTVVGRRFMDSAAAEDGRDNHTTAGDMAGLLAAVRAGVVLGQRSTQLVRDLLAEQQHAVGITALLPDHVWHGSKPGDLPGVRHDIALIETGGRWATVACVATEMYDRRHGADYSISVLPALSAVGEAVLGYLETEPVRPD